MWSAARPLVLVGGIGVAVVGIGHQVVLAITTHNFATGHDFTNHAVDNALTKGTANVITEYLALLREHGAQISMSRAATPSDNPKMERFLRTIKDEEVYLRDYRDFDEAARSIARFIHRYNTQRLHSKLGYRPPEEFERMCDQLKLPTPV